MSHRERCTKTAPAVTLPPVIKRLVLVFLMVLLPLQSVWAVASAYCQHEQGAAAQHFGHHEHQHQAADKDSLAGGSAASFHADCAFCHLGCVGVATSSPDLLPPVPASAAASPDDAFLLSIFPEGPERPKWAFAG